MSCFLTRALVSLFSAYVLLVAVGARAETPVRRFALVAGANDGGAGRVQLRYANSDAESVSRVLEDLGGVDPGDRLLLSNASRADLQEGFASVGRRLLEAKAQNERVELFLYYSGHSDEEGLLLGEEHFTYGELRQALEAIPADVRVAILDSCSSGALTRRKGGVQRPPFLIDASSKVHGHAFLTSSSADEAAQESDRIGASFFTHYLLSGMRGAADTSGDGKVTLTEAYQFAFQETLSRTERTFAGAQHPAYEMQLVGTGDLVMTDLRSTSAGLIVDENVQGRIFVRDDSGKLVVELKKTQANAVELGLSPGVYQVSVDTRGALYEAVVELSEGRRNRLGQGQLRKIKAEKNVSRGAETPERESHEKTYQKVPMQFTLVPFSDQSHLEVNFGLHLAAGHSGRLRGAELSLGFNRQDDSVEGAQLALLANVSSGPVTGAQLAIGLNHAGGDTQGAQLAIGFNRVEGDAEMAQAAVGLNWTTGSVQGAQFAVGVNALGGSLEGGQFSVGLNHVAGHLEGMQAAVGLNNLSGNITGGQFAVGVNRAGGDLQGVQAAVGVNQAASVEGLQAAVGVNHSRGNLEGLQVALGLNVVEGRAEGLQAGAVNVGVQGGELFQVGLTNVVGREMVGAQIGLIGWAPALEGAQVGLLNFGGDIDGAQIGLLNVAGGTVSGTQIGLLNFADDVDAPIGLLSFVRKGRFHLMAWADETASAQLGLQLGGRHVYGLIVGGSDFERTDGEWEWNLGLGLGGHLPVEASWLSFVNFEALTRSYHRSSSWDQLGSLHTLRLYGGWQLAKRFAVVAGPSLNVWHSHEGDDAPGFFGSSVSLRDKGETKVDLWPGFFVGIQI